MKTYKVFNLRWEVSPLETAEGTPRWFVPAEVPGAVQLDWARANGLPFPEYAGNVADYRWMEDSFWLYRARLEYPAPEDGEQAYFTCGGIDYQFQVRIDGQVVLEQEGMFTPFELEQGEIGQPGSLLEVLVYPAPKSHRRSDDRAQANRSVKPAFSYGWDFHPRLIPLGIWEECHVELRPTCHLRHVETRYSLGDTLDTAQVHLEARLSQPGEAELRWRLLDPEGDVVLENYAAADGITIHLDKQLAQPRLWWPNGQGAQDLYTSIVELVAKDGQLLDSHNAQVGFKRVRLVMPAAQWTTPGEMNIPIGADKPPITLEINGRVIFAKGSNWVSPDIFPGRVTAESYLPLLEMARDAHFNLFRVHGGSIIPKEAFFEACDALGIMVWQEFPLSCNHYEGDHYLKILDQESRSIIQRLRGHACLALWCGGNELINSWSRMTEQDLALRLLNRNTYDLDPDRPYLYSAPEYGMGHGWYVFNLPDGREVFQYLPEAHCTAYDEFAVPGPASPELLRQIIPAEELFPPGPTPGWVTRHGMRAWDMSATSWLEYETIVKYFGQPNSLEEMVEEGQFLQSVGLQFYFEEARRQKPICAMALNWCYNEPWPAAANCSLVSWPAQPKPALAEVKAALRPVLASARPAKFGWRAGETFTSDLFLLNDSPAALESGVLEASLLVGETETRLLSWSFPAAPANTNLQGPVVRCVLPSTPGTGSELPYARPLRFRLMLRVAGKPEWGSIYTMIIRP